MYPGELIRHVCHASFLFRLEVHAGRGCAEGANPHLRTSGRYSDFRMERPEGFPPSSGTANEEVSRAKAAAGASVTTEAANITVADAATMVHCARAQHQFLLKSEANTQEGNKSQPESGATCRDDEIACPIQELLELKRVEVWSTEIHAARARTPLRVLQEQV